MTWTRCAEWLDAALAEGPPTHTLDDVRRAIESGEALFAPLGRSAVVCEVREMPRARTFNIWLAGGDLTDLLTEYPRFEAAARDLDCNIITVTGRPGWARALRTQGFQRGGLTVWKGLT